MAAAPGQAMPEAVGVFVVFGLLITLAGLGDLLERVMVRLLAAEAGSLRQSRVRR